jgi:hypothetical protein
MISQFGKGAHGAGELRPRVQSLGVATFVENKKIPSAGLVFQSTG